MAPFSFSAPTNVAFGDGVRNRLPSIIGRERCGVLSSPSVRKLPAVEELLDACRKSGAELVYLGDVSPNPRLSEVEHGIEAAGGNGVARIVAVGGGSVIDAAKLLRIALQHGASGHDALRDLPRVIGQPSIPIRLCALPTTSGTGAEVSRGAIITDETSGAKLAARSEKLVPDFALIDPELTHSLPPRRTAETGFDILAHAIETYFSRASNSLTEILSEAALRVVPSALLAVLRNGQDREARTTLSLHAWLMGYNLAHASTCLPHRMQYPIGAMTDTSHQIGLAAIYPAWIRHVAEVGGVKLDEVSGALAAALPSAPHDEAPHEVMARYLEAIGIRVGLEDLGVARNDVASLTAAVDGRIDLDPLMPDRALIEEIYSESLNA